MSNNLCLWQRKKNKESGFKISKELLTVLLRRNVSGYFKLKINKETLLGKDM